MVSQHAHTCHSTFIHRNTLDQRLFGFGPAQHDGIKRLSLRGKAHVFGTKVPAFSLIEPLCLDRSGRLHGRTLTALLPWTRAVDSLAFYLHPGSNPSHYRHFFFVDRAVAAHGYIQQQIAILAYDICEPVYHGLCALVSILVI